MADSSKSAFPTVGDSVLSHVMGSPAARNSRYTTAVPVKTQGRGSSPTGRTGKKSNKMIHEANGPRCCVKVKLYSQNAAAASDSQRNVRIMPSVISRGDFWSARSSSNAA